MIDLIDSSDIMPPVVEVLASKTNVHHIVTSVLARIVMLANLDLVKSLFVGSSMSSSRQDVPTQRIISQHYFRQVEPCNQSAPVSRLSSATFAVDPVG